MEDKIINLSDIDNMVDLFLLKNDSTLRNLCIRFLGNEKLAFDSFKIEIKPFLKNTAVTFVNGNYPETAFTSYLFPTVYSFFRKDSTISVKTNQVHICPACKYLGENTQLIFNKVFKCDVCERAFKKATTGQKQKLFATFKMHAKRGYKCNDCERFIPQPLDGSQEISCPYYDCVFVGKIKSLKTMRHPTISNKIRELSLDSQRKGSQNNESLGFSLGDNLQSNTIASDEELEIKETLSSNLTLLKDTILSQANSIYYSSAEFTLTHKLCMYQAFSNIITLYPDEMVAYLVFLNRHGGIQHLIFQEYIRLLESKMPLTYTKNNKLYKITSLLDPELSLFDGISTFESEVSSKLEVKNETKEFYIGGRTGFYSRPFYIGKLLDVIDLSSKSSILFDVQEYTFSKIKFKTLNPGTKVEVTHLRVPPHYQMGGMVYLNRIRRKIVDKVYLTLHGEKRAIRTGI